MLHIKFKRITIAATRYQIFSCIPPTLGMGSIGQSSTFSVHGHVAYQVKRNHECTNKVATILPADTYNPYPPPPPPPPPPTLGIRSIGQNSTFSDHGHLVYQIKWNQEIKQHGCADPPPLPDLRVKWSKFNFFRTWSCCMSN